MNFFIIYLTSWRFSWFGLGGFKICALSHLYCIIPLWFTLCPSYLLNRIIKVGRQGVNYAKKKPHLGFSSLKQNSLLSFYSSNLLNLMMDLWDKLTKTRLGKGTTMTRRCYFMLEGLNELGAEAWTCNKQQNFSNPSLKIDVLYIFFFPSGS